MNHNKFHGVLPAFYACYDHAGEVSAQATAAFARYLMEKGVHGLYVSGSSGECIYQSVEERKLTLKSVIEATQGKVTIIAHIACNNTADSQELARYAESLGVDAIAAIPPIYFHLPEHGIAQYWNDISSAAPNTDFVIYNIPQLAGVSLTLPLLHEMKKNPRVVAVKNSSMPVQDIQMFRDEGVAVFNGPDEQFISGLTMGAIGGIGGTYAAMPELFLKAYSALSQGQLDLALKLQDDINRIIYKLCSTQANMYAMIKEVIRRQGGPDIGGVRKPLVNLLPSDLPVVEECVKMISSAISKYC